MTAELPGVEGIVLKRASVNGNGYVVLLDGGEPVRVRADAGRCPILWERGQTVPNTIAAAIGLARGVGQPAKAIDIIAAASDFRPIEDRQVG